MIHKIEAACKFISSIKDIDLGGCGVAALSVYKFAKKIGNNDKFKFVLCYPIFDEDYEKDYETDLANIMSGNFHNVEYCDHVMFSIGNGKITDVHMLNYDDYLSEAELVEISVDELVSLINKGNWNSKFNKQRYIPAIEKMLGIDLSEVK